MSPHASDARTACPALARWRTETAVSASKRRESSTWHAIHTVAMRTSLCLCGSGGDDDNNGGAVVLLLLLLGVCKGEICGDGALECKVVDAAEERNVLIREIVVEWRDNRVAKFDIEALSASKKTASRCKEIVNDSMALNILFRNADDFYIISKGRNWWPIGSKTYPSLSSKDASVLGVGRLGEIFAWKTLRFSRAAWKGSTLERLCIRDYITTLHVLAEKKKYYQREYQYTASK
jgi:hypothetical protein